MAYIYKITNELNNKSYIGKTEYPNPQKRFSEHINDRNRYPERPLYRAMNKYGIEYFSFEVIEETNEPEKREIYWIDFFGTYGSSGYNATRGGDGKKYLDEEKIIKDYQKRPNMVSVAKENDCHADSVRNILIRNNVEIISSQEVTRQQYSKKVRMLNKETLEPIKDFNSLTDAAIYLKENNLSNISEIKNLIASITRVCKKQRQTSSGFKWEYI